MMANEELRERAVAILAEEFELEPAQFVPEATLYDDLGLDSLDAVDMVVSLEKEFGLKFADSEENSDAFREIRTVGELFDFLLKIRDQSSAESS